MHDDRKLAVIMFADISGYTALMQRNEEQAMSVLHRFNEVIHAQSASHGGNVIQFFGDGCLLSFGSAVQSVQCAIAMQQAFALPPKVPVRIGIHLGDVVFSSGNAFGDGVNIASRVESLGVPGAVLLSKTVGEQVKNKPGFILQSVGDFHFKNVDEPMEIYAVANEGCVVPRREEMQGKLKASTRRALPRWTLPALGFVVIVVGVLLWLVFGNRQSSTVAKQLREKRVAVLAFSNQTNDTSLHAFGLMAKDWISQGLLESGEAYVIKETDNLPGSDLQEKSSNLASAEVLIKGRYFSKGEELLITADIVDSKSNHVYYSIPPLTGKKTELMDLLVSLQQQVLGYWNLKDAYLGRRPPRFDAYKAYVNGLSLREPYPYTRKIEYFKKAAQLDKDFAEPFFALYNICRWGLVTAVCDSALAGLAAREDGFSDYQLLRWRGIQAMRGGEMAKAAGIEWQLFKTYKLESNAQMAIHQYRYANYLQKVLELYSVYKREIPQPDENVMGMAVNALYDLGKYDTLLSEINNHDGVPVDLDIAVAHLRALARLHKAQELEAQVAVYKDAPLQFGGFYKPPMLLFSLVEELYIMNDQAALEKYLDKLEQWMKQTSEDDFLFYAHHLATVYYMRGNYTRAYELSKVLWQKHRINFFAGLTGVCLLKMGKVKEADLYLQEIQSRSENLPGATSYAMGVIEAQRNPALAIHLLQKAIQQGYEFTWYSFQHDYLLKDIMKDPQFVALTEPRIIDK